MVKKTKRAKIAKIGLRFDSLLIDFSKKTGASKREATDFLADFLTEERNIYPMAVRRAQYLKKKKKERWPY